MSDNMTFELPETFGRASAKNWFDEGQVIMAKKTKGNQKDPSKWQVFDRTELSKAVEEAGFDIPKNLSGDEKKIGLTNKGSVGNTIEYKCIAGEGLRRGEDPKYTIFTKKVAEAFREGISIPNKDYTTRELYHHHLTVWANGNDKTKRKKAKAALKEHFGEEYAEEPEDETSNAA